MIRRGVFAVFKPSGIRSAEVAAKIKTVLLQKLREKQVLRKDASTASSDLKSTATASTNYVKSRTSKLKVGHGGTLDGLAEGVLVIGIGQDCKKLTQYLKGDKGYMACGELGKSTDTGDAGGIVMEQKTYKHIQRVDLEGTLQSFKGETFQTPPVYSALKHHGVRFSDLARSSKPIEPQPRRITIYSISLLNFQPPYFKISVSCASGTYIRSLIRDIGLQLGTVAHMTQLLRTKQGMFTLGDAF